MTPEEKVSQLGNSIAMVVTFDKEQVFRVANFDSETNITCIIPGKYELLYGGTSDNNQLKTLQVTIQ